MKIYCNDLCYLTIFACEMGGNILFVIFRSARGQNALRELLNPLVRDVIEDRNLQINTNPIEVYKAWVNQMECQTGKAR